MEGFAAITGILLFIVIIVVSSLQKKVKDLEDCVHRLSKAIDQNREHSNSLADYLRRMQKPQE